MAITYAPWDPVVGPLVDTNGILNATDLAVSSDGVGMDVQVAPGSAWLVGNFVSDSDVTLSVAPNTSGMTRRDLIVARVEYKTTNASIEILTGDTNPEQTKTIWEFPLAVVLVPNNATNISQANIYDLRVLSNEETPLEVARITYNANFVLGSGREVTLKWNNNPLRDPLDMLKRTSYIKPKLDALFKLTWQIRWEPATSTDSPLLVNIYNSNRKEEDIYKNFYAASIQKTAGNVDFVGSRFTGADPGTSLFFTLKNLSDQDMTIKTTANFPVIKVELINYPIVQPYSELYPPDPDPQPEQ